MYLKYWISRLCVSSAGIWIWLVLIGTVLAGPMTIIAVLLKHRISETSLGVVATGTGVPCAVLATYMLLNFTSWANRLEDRLYEDTCTKTAPNVKLRVPFMIMCGVTMATIVAVFARAIWICRKRV